MPDQPSPEILVPSEIYLPDADRVVWVPRPTHRYWLHILLLLATVFTTLVVGARLESNFLRGLPPFALANDESVFPFLWALHGRNLLLGIPFSLTLMLILLAHEMGHYLYCVKYRVSATLPFFIPFPTLIGTLGAFIRIRAPLRSRSILFDIGIAGPIAGFVVALPILIFSLGQSHVVPLAPQMDHIDIGYPLIFHLARKLLIATGHGAAIATVPLSRMYLSPVAIAAWVGMFATSLNLLPGGQLDGGHIVFAVSPRAHKNISVITIVALIVMSVYWWIGWLLWAILLRISGKRHPAVAEWPDISTGRRVLAGFALLMLVLTICYRPLSQPDGPQSLAEVLQALWAWGHQLLHFR